MTYYSRRKQQKESSEMGKTTLSSFTMKVIQMLDREGKERTGEAYKAALSSFMQFREGEEVMLRSIKPDMLINYEIFLRERGISMNTVSFYMRILRAVYNRAVNYGMVRQNYPFRFVYTGVSRTVKRAIPIDLIKELKALELKRFSPLSFARDMFLFSFYTRGMAFVDMAFLRRRNIVNGVLSYRRRKTGQVLSIRMEDCMWDIIDKYALQSTVPYLLPILNGDIHTERLQYKNALNRVNRLLKTIGRMLDLPDPLSMYVARHSWATTAKEKEVPLSVISEGMGHDSEKTTMIYLASMNSTAIDKANQLILKEMFPSEVFSFEVKRKGYKK